jgi:hypothetical protein
VQDCRQIGEVIPLTVVSHAAMNQCALEHAPFGICGTGVRVVVRRTSDKPIGGAMVHSATENVDHSRLLQMRIKVGANPT